MQKPAPRPTSDTREFWSACNAERFLYQRCGNCGRAQFYPRQVCASCNSGDLSFELSGGQGSVHSYTIVHHPADESFRADGPFVIALVDFDEGFRAMLNIVGGPPSGIGIGIRVEVIFEQRTPEQKIPQARLRPT